jgi:hypothetical protein
MGVGKRESEKDGSRKDKGEPDDAVSSDNTTEVRTDRYIRQTGNLTEHHTMKAYWGSGVIASLIL